MYKYVYKVQLYVEWERPTKHYVKGMAPSNQTCYVISDKKYDGRYNDDLVKELKLARTISPADNAKVRDLLEKEHLGTISTTEKAALDNFETNPVYRELITQYRSSFLFPLSKLLKSPDNHTR